MELTNVGEVVGQPNANIRPEFQPRRRDPARASREVKS